MSAIRSASKKIADFRQLKYNLTQEQLKEEVRKSERKVREANIAMIVFVVISLITAAYIFYKGYYTVGVLWTFGAVGTLLYDLPLRTMSRVRVVIGGLALLTTTWAVAFSMGYESGETPFRSDAREIVTLGETAIPARLVRVGERGALFVDVNDTKMRFARWDDIKNIETMRR
jgi:hypothetical protein